jgi:hypothetical protein
VDVKVLLDLDDLIKCIIGGQLPKLAVLRGVKMPSELEGVDAALIVNI